MSVRREKAGSGRYEDLSSLFMGRRHEREREEKRRTRPWWDREHKLARRESNRRVRHQTRSRLGGGEQDQFPRAPRTEGWMTW